MRTSYDREQEAFISYIARTRQKELKYNKQQRLRLEVKLIRLELQLIRQHKLNSKSKLRTTTR